DKEGKVVDPSHYRGMIGTILYLTASRPDLQFVICMCARYQARPTEKHLHAVKMIFRYIRGTVNQGLWYPNDSLIALTAFADADHAGCQDTRRSTSGQSISTSDITLSRSTLRMSVDHPAPEVIALIAEVVAPKLAASTDSPSSTTVDQDTPSLSNSQSTPKTQPPVIPNDVEEDSHDIEVAQVYVSQSDGFVDPDNPNHVYKLKKALYGLKQAPRAWYDMLSSFLISQDFSKGSVDPTLFICRNGNDLLLDSLIALTTFADANHAGCQDTRRSTYDIFTKALGRERIEFLINKLGMRSFTPKTLQQLTDEVDE
nr:copia protein [Tanacetum cinerariifolium]